ncbi:surface antigen BspA-like [Trichomonas vaginalis G3]|nr:FNIP repeat-containing protein [Trichomonas vaginalis G3]EAX68618.1 surface antigen BspA-like [Trichomonas vaginalis G3]KAI5495564.1 FNIP repeat-containing protein [Trichomonas vaginalis G3]|eukprot:XP_001281548.1 surface antigen BspA-like [Trichomonas vaginalis G3]
MELPKVHCKNLKFIEILSLGGDCTIGSNYVYASPDDDLHIKIYIEKDVKSIDDEAFSDVNIDIFAYFGTNELEGNFLANAKSIRGVIASTNYQGDSIGGVKLTKKVPSYNIEEDNTNYELAKSAGLSGGAIAGIVIGVIVVIAIIAVVCFFIIRSKKKKSEDTAGNDV